MNPSPEVQQFGKRSLDELTLRLEELQLEWTEVNAKRNAWLVILGTGEGEVDMDSKSSGDERKETTVDSANRDKGDVVRQAISNTGENGFQPKDITSKVEAMGVVLPSGFVSNLVFRMKKKNELVEHRGKYFLPNFDPRPRLFPSAAKDQGATEVTP